MHDDVAMSTAAKELGLEPGEMALAAQLGEVHTVRPAPSATASRADGGPVRRRVPRAEVARLRAAEDFPDGLRARLRVVDAGGGAELLGITAPRFARLARGGCFSPVRFYVNRYRTVVWLYLARELSAFAEDRPELLSGSLPRGLRVLLAEGVDLRAGHWRGRRVGQLCRQAEGPWEAAAARAAVLGEEVLREAVPEADERARLSVLRPELVPLRGRPPAVREVAEELCRASAEDEIFWQRLMLAADLESARSSQSAPGDVAGAASPADSADSACSLHATGAGDPLHITDAGRAAAESAGCRGARTPAGRPPVRLERGPHPKKAARVGADGSHGRARPAQQRARVLNTLRASRQRAPWWAIDTGPARPRGLSRPAF